MRDGMCGRAFVCGALWFLFWADRVANKEVMRVRKLGLTRAYIGTNEALTAITPQPRLRLTQK